MKPLEEYLGGQRVFGRLTFVGEAPTGETAPSLRKGRFHCECGRTVVTAARSVKRGATLSCGCLRTEVITERHARQRAASAVHRAAGSAGIAVTTLRARIKRGMPLEEAARFTGHVPMGDRYDFHGDDLTLSEIGEITGIDRHRLYSRLRVGWSMEQAAGEAPSPPQFRKSLDEITGGQRRFGSLELVDEVDPEPTYTRSGAFRGYTRMALLLCDCGSEKVIRLYNVISGLSQSCGCKRQE